MFDKLMRLFTRRRQRATPPASSDFLRPKDEPVELPEQAAMAGSVAPDRQGLPAASIQEKPPVILLPSVSTAPAAASRPTEEARPVALPPDVDPERVAVVKHEEKKVGGERFKYTDRPLKPLGVDGKKPELIKYTDKTAGGAPKPDASPAPASTRSNDRERRGTEVFKYSPSRVEIKN